MQPEGSRRHRYSSNMCGDRAFLRTESHTARRGSCFLFFLHTAPNCYYYSFFLQRNQYFLLYMCWQIIPAAGLCSTWPTLGPLWNVTQNGTLAFLTTALPLSGKRRACTRTPQSFASGFRAAAPFLFSRCFALCITHCALFHLPYSFTGFSFYFFVFFRLFLHWIYAFCICNSTYVYIYKQVLSLPVKSSMCPSRLSCSVWYRVILTYIYVHCFRWLVRNHLLS